MRKIVFCLMFLVFISSIAIAQEIPTLQKYVNDNANVLTSSDIARINALAAHIEENTTVQIAVLVVDTTEPSTIEQYAVEVFEKAGIGFEDKDNGLLIVVAINDRRWRLEVGYGLEPIITDSTASLIGTTYMTPAFKEERYGDGLYDAVDAVYQVIQNSGDTSFISEQIDVENVIPVIIILIFVFIPFIMVFASMFATPKCPKCGGRMKCHVEGDYVICECIKCKMKTKKKRSRVPWWLIFFVGSRGSGRSGGGFSGGGFGGGSSGGGGASGGW
ncbi:MAG: TPM domain-containing protein [Candidatus Aenigmatarchaeota archaeon]